MSEHNSVGSHDLIDLALTLEWRSEEGRHEETQHFLNYNIWRDLDLLPPALQGEILHRPQGYSGSVTVAAGEVTPQHDPRLVVKIKRENFNGRFQGREITPCAGRFYPQGMVKGLPGGFSSSVLPLRITHVDEQWLTCDLNHPLAGHDFTISSNVGAIHGAPEEHGGRCQDAMEQLLHGPGMQARYARQPTDFFSGNPFVRIDASHDSGFYRTARMTEHLDSCALGEVEKLYASLLPGGAHVLDLMASIDSHIGDSDASIVGLGMNADELAANRRLSERLVHDLNQQPTLPFANDSFDAVVCTVSVEYLVKPLEVFAEVRRVLKPGGLFINTFSNRWFPPKVIALWIDLHEFERMGLVSEYFHRTAGFGAVTTRSLQGLSRPDDDKYSGQMGHSDPLYAVWARKEPCQGTSV
jgi:SAM-dependent methyltransferase/FKBP-type peptidyl-prolyl cis-trans isomerase 2